MNWEQIEGRWDQFKGQLRTKWGKLTDDDIESSKGRLDSLVGKIRERYGEGKETIERELDRLIGSL